MFHNRTTLALGIAALVVILSSAGLSQDGSNTITLTGFVKDDVTRRAIVDAKVTLPGLQAVHEDYTDSKGVFTLGLSSWVKPGATVRIRVEKEGYEIHEEKIAVGIALPYEISLTPKDVRKKKTSSPKPKEVSFSFISPGVYMVGIGWDFIVNHRGPDVSYNAEVMLVDEGNRQQLVNQKKPFLTRDDVNTYLLVVKYPEVDAYGRGSAFATQIPWKTLSQDHERYSIEVNWRDGGIHQELGIERIDGDKWVWATRVTDRATGKLLLSCKDKGFPYGPPNERVCFPEIAFPDKGPDSVSRSKPR
jgi:hypothetical protein